MPLHSSYASQTSHTSDCNHAELGAPEAQNLRRQSAAAAAACMLISSLHLMHNASSEAPLLQVVMDILGCLVTCLTCNLLLHQLAGMLPIS